MDWTPQNPESWQQLATVAEAMLDIQVIDANGLLRDYRVPTIDADRCRRVLAAARHHGIVTVAADVNAVTEQLLRQFHGGRR